MNNLGVSISSWALENFLRRLYNPKRRANRKFARNRHRQSRRHQTAYKIFFSFYTSKHSSEEKIRVNAGYSFPMDFSPYGKSEFG